MLSILPGKVDGKGVNYYVCIYAFIQKCIFTLRTKEKYQRNGNRSEIPWESISFRGIYSFMS